MLAGYYVLYIGAPHISVEVLLPAGLLAAEALLRKQTYGRLLSFSAVLFLVMVGGMPESACLLMAVVCLYIIFRLSSDREIRRLWWRSAKYVVTGIISAVSLAAFLLLPFTDYLRRSFNYHETSSVAFIAGLVHDPLDLSVFAYVFPLLYGPPLSSTLSFNFTGLRDYIGLLSVFLMMVAVLSLFGGWTKRYRTLNSLTSFFFGLVLLALLKQYGWGPINSIGGLPVLNLIYFPKYVGPILSISASIVCAIGLEKLISREVSTYVKIIALALSFVLLPFAIFLSRATLTKEVFVDHVPASFPITAVTVPVCVLFFLSIALILSERKAGPVIAQKQRDTNLGIWICLLLTAEAMWNFIVPMYFLFNHPPFRSRNPYVGAPYIDFLRDKSFNHFRVFAREGVLYPNWAAAFQLYDIRDLDAMYPRKYLPFVQNFLWGPELSADLRDRFTGLDSYPFKAASQRRLLQLSSVKYIAAVSPFNGFHIDSVVDEILRQNQGRILKGKENSVRRADTSINGVGRESLFEHPPYERLPYKVTVDRQGDGILHFFYALHPAVYDKGGDGVGFTIDVRDHSGNVSRVFSNYINPKQDLRERRWMDGNIDLEKYRGQTIELLLSTDPGPKNDTTYDWALWSGFHFGPDRTTEGDIPFKLIYDHEIKIFEYDDILPRAGVFYNADIEKTSADVLHKLRDPSLDVSKTIVVAAPDLDKQEVEGLKEINDGVPRSVEPARITSYKSESVDLDVSPNGNAVLMLNDTDYPGWDVYVDGREGKWFTANYMFRGVLLASGKHHVRFVYRPLSFYIGAWISLASAAFLLILGWFSRSKRRAEKSEKAPLPGYSVPV